MERKEAVGILKSILDKCSTENVTKVMIMPSTNENAFTPGSQIYIEANFDAQTLQYLQTIIQQYHLAIKEDVNRIIIYKPTQVIKT